MARCGCNENAVCNCVVQGHPDGSATVTGVGSAANPYIVQGHPSVEVVDTATVDLTLTGQGTPGDPFVLQADVLSEVCAGDCLELDGAGCLSVVVAPTTDDGCENDLSCTPAGLFVPQHHRVAARYDNPYNNGTQVAKWSGTTAERFVFQQAGGTTTPGVVPADIVPVGQFTNPDPCCPMVVTFDLQMRHRVQFNDDPCGAAAAFLNAGPLNAGGLGISVNTRLFVDGVQQGVAKRDAHFWHVDTGNDGCGLDYGWFQNDRSPTTLTLAPGQTIQLGTWTEYIVAGDGNGGPGDAQYQQLYDFLAQPGNPGNELLQVSWDGLTVEGVSTCQSVEGP